MEQIGLGAAAVLLGLALAVVAISWVWRTAARSSIIERLERSMVSNQSRLDSNQNRLDAQEAEIDDLRRQIIELREGRIVDHALLQEWINYARRLATMFTEATGKEPPPEPEHRPRPITTADMARLARTIEAHYSLDEINTLAFELGIASSIAGDTVEARARSLVDVARKRGLIARLIQLYREQRPNGGLDD
mgnify:CR=1 FL=1